VLGLFEAAAPDDGRPRDAIARARAFARGELGVVDEIRRRFVGHDAAREVGVPAAAAAARAAGQAASIPHMGAHALGAAAYAAKAAELAAPGRPEAVSEEIRWQLGHMSAATRTALRELPPVGENSAGPSGRGFSPQAFLARSSVISRPAWRTPTTPSLPDRKSIRKTESTTAACSPSAPGL